MESTAEMTEKQYDRENEKAAEAFMAAERKEYPNMPKNQEENCAICRQRGKGFDEFPCDDCYESWR